MLVSHLIDTQHIYIIHVHVVMLAAQLQCTCTCTFLELTVYVFLLTFDTQWRSLHHRIDQHNVWLGVLLCTCICDFNSCGVMVV